jgi:flagellar hook assembly protein FlgD
LLTDSSVDYDGWYIDDVHIEAGREVVGVEDDRDNVLPTTFSLGQNYPNPFNPATSIQYSVVSDQSPPHHVTLKIYNLLGQEVKVLVHEVQKPGYYTVIWEGRDNTGHEVGSGIYFYRLQVGDFIRSKKMVLLR